MKKNDFENFILPTNNKELNSFVKNNKIKMMQRVVDSIEFALRHDLHVAEVFQFDKSDFIITIPSSEFHNNITNIYNQYLSSENYELCDRVCKIKNLLEKTNSVYK